MDTPFARNAFIAFQPAAHILVADSHKFGEVHASYFCDLADIDCIVTDAGLSAQGVQRIESMGIRLYRV